MESEKIYQMVLEAAEARAVLDVIKSIVMSDAISDYAKFDAICAALGIGKSDLQKKRGEPST